MNQYALINFYRLICGFGLLLCIHSAHAEDYVVERGWVEDTSGTMTLEQVRALPEKPLKSTTFGKGYSQSNFWIRLRIDPSKKNNRNTDSSLVIRMRPVYQDTVELFDPLSIKEPRPVTGDFVDWAHDEWRSLNLNFVVPLGSEARDVWLKLRTHQAVKTNIEVVSSDEALRLDRRQETFSTLYLALILFVISWAVLNWISHRDPIVGWFLVRSITTFIYLFSLLGYTRNFASGWLPASWLDPIFNISLWVFVASAIWFDSKLIEEFKANRLLVKLIRLLVIALPIELLMALMDRMALGVIINYLVTAIAAILVFLGAVSTSAWNSPSSDNSQLQRIVPKPVFVAMYSMAILLVIYDRLAAMDIVPSSKNLIDLILLYPLPISIFMMLLLQLRSYRLNLQRQAVQKSLEISQREAELEKNQRIEQERFLSMLTHELKTPISIAKINLGISGIHGKERERIDRALKNMADVVERCRISAAMEDKRLKIDLETFQIGLAIEGLLGLMNAHDRVKFIEVNDAVIHTDSQLFTVIVSNLLDNALKYSPQASTIFVKIDHVDNHGVHGLSVFVKNQVLPGGIPDPDRVFTKYYRSQVAESKSGSGLGLYICAGLAQMLGGMLRYQASDDALEFELWIPA